MHSYLRSIGFSKCRKDSDIQPILDQVFQDFDEKETAKNNDSIFFEMTKYFGPDMGIKICGEIDNYGFHREYYLPFFIGSGITTTEEVMVEKHGARDSYAGMCEDGRIGVSIIFYVQNAAAYKNNAMLSCLRGNLVSTTFSGLASEGMVLMPIKKEEKQQSIDQQSSSGRSRLMKAAKNGDEEAIENLTMEDIDLYAMISRRIQKEDVFSIVDTFFMPFGMECDQYQIMGEIKFCTKVRNSLTKEIIYQMTVECNSMVFDICINKHDLMGDPEVGRRFKGVIWLQGKLNFPD